MNLEVFRARYRSDEEFREKIKRRASEWAKRNRDKINAHRRVSPKAQESQRKYNTSDKRRRYMRSVWLSRKYGVSLEEYERISASQNGVCAICECAPDVATKHEVRSTVLRVDHDHTTNKVRGLLCHNCNVALGLFKDNANLLARAADYLCRD